MIAALFFYLFAGICVASAFMVIAARNPVHSVLFLILAFVNAAGLFVMMGAEFLAMILIVVYVGAVAVLFLFVVMMLDVNFDSMRQHFRSYLPVGAAVGILVFFEMALVILGSAVGPVAGAPAAPAGSNTQALGALLYVDYVYPFEIAAVVLLVAIVAAIALTHRERREMKHQDASAQVRARASERVRLVSMPSEKPPV